MKAIKLIFVLCSICLLASCVKKPSVSTTPTVTFKVINTNKPFYGVKVIKLSNGKYVAALQGSSFPDYPLLIEADETGKEICRKELLNDSIQLVDLQAVQDSNFVVSTIGIRGSYSSYLTCYSAGMNTVWNSVYSVNPNFTNSVIAIGNDNSINMAVGVQILNNNLPQEFITFNNSGNETDTTSIDTIITSNTIPALMVSGPDGLYITGYCPNRDSSLGNYLIKTDWNGNVLWVKGGVDTTDAGGVRDNYLGEALCYGPSNSNTVVQAGPVGFDNSAYGDNQYDEVTGNVFVIKYNSLTGDTLNTNVFTLQGLSNRVFMNNTADGGYIIAATDNIFRINSYSPYHGALLKIDQGLNEQWQQTYDIPYPTAPFGIFQASDGGYIVFAMIQTFNNNQQLAIIKTDAQGKIDN